MSAESETRKIAMILPGLGRVQRGAETAFLEVARGLARIPGVEVELFGSGSQQPEGVTLHQVPCRHRETFEKWPKLPALRTDCHYEELSFVFSLYRSGVYDPQRFDAVVACSYPWVNWFLQWTSRGKRPKQIFVTQNGDWMCHASSREYKYFRCDGLVCINPLYYETHKGRYPSVLIPNGVDPHVFRPSEVPLAKFDNRIPSERPTVVMVSALIPSKGVDLGIQAMAQVPDAFLLVAGDGPERARLAELADRWIPGRHLFLGSIDRAKMPQLFQTSDAFLHCSRDEPFGIVYLEAGATGLPIVAPDGEVPRWIMGDTALYADPTDAGGLANAIQEAIDPTRKAERGAKARSRILDGWTWDVQAGRYYDFINMILNQDEAEGHEHKSNPPTEPHSRQLQHEGPAPAVSRFGREA